MIVISFITINILTNDIYIIIIIIDIPGGAARRKGGALELQDSEKGEVLYMCVYVYMHIYIYIYTYVHLFIICINDIIIPKEGRHSAIVVDPQVNLCLSLSSAHLCSGSLMV